MRIEGRAGLSMSRVAGARPVSTTLAMPKSVRRNLSIPWCRIFRFDVSMIDGRTVFVYVAENFWDLRVAGHVLHLWPRSVLPDQILKNCTSLRTYNSVV